MLSNAPFRDCLVSGVIIKVIFNFLSCIVKANETSLIVVHSVFIFAAVAPCVQPLLPVSPCLCVTLCVSAGAPDERVVSYVCALQYVHAIFYRLHTSLQRALTHFHGQEVFVSLLNGRRAICVVISLKTVLQPHQRTTCQ